MEQQSELFSDDRLEKIIRLVQERPTESEALATFLNKQFQPLPTDNEISLEEIDQSDLEFYNPLTRGGDSGFRRNRFAGHPEPPLLSVSPPYKQIEHAGQKIDYRIITAQLGDEMGDAKVYFFTLSDADQTTLEPSNIIASFAKWDESDEGMFGAYDDLGELDTVTPVSVKALEISSEIQQAFNLLTSNQQRQRKAELVELLRNSEGGLHYLPTRGRNSLREAGIKTIYDIYGFTAFELSDRIPNVGDTSVEGIKRSVESIGLKLPENKEDVIFGAMFKSVFSPSQKVDYENSGLLSSTVEALDKTGIITIGDLTKLSEDDLFAVPGISQAGVECLIKSLKDNHFNLPAEI